MEHDGIVERDYSFRDAYDLNQIQKVLQKFNRQFHKIPQKPEKWNQCWTIAKELYDCLNHQYGVEIDSNLIVENTVEIIAKLNLEGQLAGLWRDYLPIVWLYYRYLHSFHMLPDSARIQTLGYGTRKFKPMKNAVQEMLQKNPEIRCLAALRLIEYLLQRLNVIYTSLPIAELKTRVENVYFDYRSKNLPALIIAVVFHSLKDRPEFAGIKLNQLGENLHVCKSSVYRVYSEMFANNKKELRKNLSSGCRT